MVALSVDVACSCDSDAVLRSHMPRSSRQLTAGFVRVRVRTRCGGQPFHPIAPEYTLMLRLVVAVVRVEAVVCARASSADCCST